MTNLAWLRADLRTFSLAIEQPLSEWQAASLALQTRTTVIDGRVIGSDLLGAARAASEIADEDQDVAPAVDRLLDLDPIGGPRGQPV
jgi:hypothetical protein